MIDLTDLEATRTAPHAYGLIRMVLLLSVKDQADQVSFLRTPDGMRMRLRVSGEWYEMVPPPATVAPEILATLRRMSNLAGARHRSGIPWLSRLAGRAAGRPSARETGSITLVVGETALPVTVTFSRSRWQEEALLEMQPVQSVALPARDTLRALFESRGHDSPEEDVSDGPDLADEGWWRRMTPAEKRFWIAVLVALRDGAKQLDIQLTGGRLTTTCQVEGRWREVDEIRRLAGLADPQLLSWLWPPRRIRIRLKSRAREQVRSLCFRVNSSFCSADVLITADEDLVSVKPYAHPPVTDTAARLIERYREAVPA
jgi:hypothetical protein